MSKKKPPGAGPAYLTTFQVAKILGVTAPTVVNWINAGHLKAHRTVGGHRRIPGEEVTQFALRHNHPIPASFMAQAPEAGRKVLIVDDDPDYRDVLSSWLSARGDYEVEVAESGFAAGLTMGRFKPDVVVMDILMPGMDGFESLRRLREDDATASIPVIACTAMHDPGTEARARREGFADYIEKTLPLDRIQQTIDRLLAQVAAART